MSMQDGQRRAYLERAGVTPQQIDQTVGELPIHEAGLRGQGITLEHAEHVRSAIRLVLGDAAIIAAKYSAVANTEGVAAPAADEVAADRRHLEELFAPEQRFVLTTED